MKKLLHLSIGLFAMFQIQAQPIWGGWWASPSNPKTWSPNAISRPELTVYPLPLSFDLNNPNDIKSTLNDMQQINTGTPDNFDLGISLAVKSASVLPPVYQYRLPDSDNDFSLKWGAAYNDTACFIFIQKTDDDNQAGDTSFQIQWAGYSNHFQLHTDKDCNIIIPNGYEDIMADTSKMWLRWDVARFGWWTNGYAGVTSWNGTGCYTQINNIVNASPFGNVTKSTKSQLPLPTPDPNDDQEGARARKTKFSLVRESNTLYYVAAINWSEFGLATMPEFFDGISLNVNATDYDNEKRNINAIGSTGNLYVNSLVSYSTFTHKPLPICKSTACKAIKMMPETACYTSNYGYDDFIIDGIETSQLQNVSLYPNPAADKLQISNVKGGSILTITDFTGRSVLSTTILNNEVNVSNLPQGVYMLRITEGKNTGTYKLMKR